MATPVFGAGPVRPSDISLPEAEIEAPTGDRKRIEEEHRQRREAKLNAQVYDQPTCGSTWKNPDPPAPSAWRLVDSAGMRGEVRGGAQVSPKHANFIVNEGGATSADVHRLIEEVATRVFELFEVRLQREIVLAPPAARTGSKS